MAEQVKMEPQSISPIRLTASADVPNYKLRGWGKFSASLAALAVCWILPLGVGIAGDIHGSSIVEASLDISGSDYRLGPGDKIRVMVNEWRPAKDEIYSWTAINGEYGIGPSGNISLPLVGDILVRDKSTRDLAAVISARLRHGMGLATAPDTSVSIVAFRPFYIVGDVEKAGEYEFRPGLMVLQAVGLGGGLYREHTGNMRLERDLVNARGDISRIMHERSALLVRRARLEAEFNGDNSVPCPAELARGNGPGQCATPLIEQERRIFVARRKAFDSQMQTLRNLKDYLDRESKTVSQQMGTHEKQVGFVQQELEGVRALNRKGLATSPRRLGLERNLAQLEGSGLQYDRDLMRIRQDISKTEIAIAELEDKRAGEITAELQNMEIKLGQLEVQMLTAQGLLNEAMIAAPSLLRAKYGGEGKLNVTYTIIRSQRGSSVEMPATETTMLLPGDTLKVAYADGDSDPNMQIATVPPPPEPKDENADVAMRYGENALARILE